MVKLSGKVIAGLVAGSVVVAGAAVAIPVAIVANQETKTAQELQSEAAILRVTYNSDLKAPASPAGYGGGTLAGTNYVVGMPVVTASLWAKFQFYPDGTVPGLKTKIFDYRVVIDYAQAVPSQTSITKSHVYGSSTVVPPSDEEFPKRDGTGYLPWNKNPTLWAITTRSETTTLEKIMQMPAGSRFYALYTSLVDTANYTGNSDVFRVDYQVVRSTTTAVKVARTGTVTYGTQVLPGSDVVLPELPDGYDSWTGPVYEAPDGSLVTEAILSRMQAGSTFTATWRAELDVRYYFGEASIYRITYTITKQYAPTPAQSTLFDSTSLVYGATLMPRLSPDRYPDLPTGYLSWSSAVVFTTPDGSTFDPADLSTSPAGTVILATYATIPNPNYDVQPYNLIVSYTIARAPASSPVRNPVSDNSSLIEGQTTFPVYASLPIPANGYLAWSAPVFTDANGVVVTLADLPQITAGTTITATYTSTVDSNHIGTPATFVVLYTVAARQPSSAS